MMIFLFIMNEFSVDNFHKDGAHIYRVMRGFQRDGKTKRGSLFIRAIRTCISE
jgi:putative ABC transport system permease protein